jgi:hypothetical protein
VAAVAALPAWPAAAWLTSPAVSLALKEIGQGTIGPTEPAMLTPWA